MADIALIDSICGGDGPLVFKFAALDLPYPVIRPADGFDERRYRPSPLIVSRRTGNDQPRVTTRSTSAWQEPPE